MSNALATTNENTAVAVSGNPFLDAANDMGAGTSALYLKFDGNTGDYTFGKDQEELEKGTRVAVAPSEFKNGWICWKDSEVQEEIMVRITDGKPPAKHTLTDHGPYDDEKDGWSQQSSAQFRDIETGAEYLYKTSSKGGRIALGNLVQDYGKAFQRHPGELAIVELSNTSFDAKDPKNPKKKLGKKYAPVFKIVGWVSEAELLAKFDAMAADENDDDGDEDEAPPPVSTKATRGKDF